MRQPQVELTYGPSVEHVLDEMPSSLSFTALLTNISLIVSTYANTPFSFCPRVTVAQCPAQRAYVYARDKVVIASECLSYPLAVGV